tara:strand:+ start:1955 stop:2179 length:225 start_codon:yes stop_codon:yes gene_type:complete
MDCPICLDETKNKFKIITPCEHTFCLDCFIKIKKNICPMCRKTFDKGKYFKDNNLEENIKIFDETDFYYTEPLF